MSLFTVALCQDDLEALAVGEATPFLEAMATLELAKRARAAALISPPDSLGRVGGISGTALDETTADGPRPSSTPADAPLGPALVRPELVESVPPST